MQLHARVSKSRRADFRDMKEALRKAVNAKYPPTHYVDPDGAVPPLVEKAMRHSLQEPSEASSIFEKSAIPGDAPTNYADVFEHMRPQAFFLERHSNNVEDPNATRAAALSNYSVLQIQTGSDFVDQ